MSNSLPPNSEDTTLTGSAPRFSLSWRERAQAAAGAVCVALAVLLALGFVLCPTLLCLKLLRVLP